MVDTAHDHGGAPGGSGRCEAESIRSNIPGSFAWSVLQQRHPALIAQVRDAFPYPPRQQQALELLLEEITTGVITSLDRGAHDQRAWTEWGEDRVGRRWFDVEFLWAESYFYRRLLASVWGNRADLGFRLSTQLAGQADQIDTAVIADDSALMWSLLEHNPPGTVCVVADNAGRELLPDLALIDHLLRTGLASRVALHIKPHPYYVSDAVTADVVAGLRRLRATDGAAGLIGGRLWDATRAGVLELRSHAFHCAPLSFHHMPDDLAEEFATATVTIAKGDLNYRRLVGDCAWAPTRPFAELTGYFPGPLVALRTLKSDVAVGLTESVVTALDTSGEAWRTTGAHAVIHARP